MKTGAEHLHTALVCRAGSQAGSGQILGLGYEVRSVAVDVPRISPGDNNRVDALFEEVSSALRKGSLAALRHLA